LEEYFTKKFSTVRVPRDIKCDQCDATGFSDKQRHHCRGCRGAGIVVQTIRQGPIIQQIQTVCPACEGKKYDTKLLDLKCANCNGKGSVVAGENIEVAIPIDIIRNNTTILPEKGLHEGKQIDLMVIFMLKMSKGYSKTSDGKLVYIMHINYPETICGFKRTINHPSGKKILIVSEKGYVINPDNIYLLDRLGFSNDIMYLSIQIHYPETITLPKKKTLTFENLESAMGTRRAPNVENDEIEPECIYTLSTVSKINNNPRVKDDNESTNNNEDNPDALSSDDDDEVNEQRSGVPGCAQQ